MSKNKTDEQLNLLMNENEGNYSIQKDPNTMINMANLVVNILRLLLKI